MAAGFLLAAAISAEYLDSEVAFDQFLPPTRRRACVSLASCESSSESAPGKVASTKTATLRFRTAARGLTRRWNLKFDFQVWLFGFVRASMLAFRSTVAR